MTQDFVLFIVICRIVFMCVRYGKPNVTSLQRMFMGDLFKFLKRTISVNYVVVVINDCALSRKRHYPEMVPSIPFKKLAVLFKKTSRL